MLLREYRTRYSQEWMMRVVLIVCTDAEPGDSMLFLTVFTGGVFMDV